MKTILFVSYYYPPGFPVGYERILKFRKYLPEHGYDSVVVGTRVLGGSSWDQSQRVYRTSELAMIYRRLLRAMVGEQSGGGDRPAPRGMSEGSRLQGIRDWLLEWIFIPDLHVLWLPFAVWTGMRAMRREKVDVIVATSGPETNLLVGLLLSLWSGKPLIADFRDGWIFEPLRPFLRTNCFRKFIDGLLEKCVVLHSAAVTTVSEPLTEYFRRRYGLSPERAVTITNGFDSDDWSDVLPRRRTDSRFRIVNTGSFGLSRSTTDPMVFFDAVARLPVDVRSRLEVLLIGNLLEREQKAVEERGLGDVVHILSPVPKKEALGYQLSADALLLMIGSDLSVATTKLFEYLVARRPILAVGLEGAAACRIIRAAGAGMQLPPDDPDSMATVLANLVRTGKAIAVPENGSDLGAYDRRHLAGRLASLADAVAGGPRSDRVSSSQA
jgi:glycosyltransferase involved in cell wall biosynthesis